MKTYELHQATPEGDIIVLSTTDSRAISTRLRIEEDNGVDLVDFCVTSQGDNWTSEEWDFVQPYTWRGILDWTGTATEFIGESRTHDLTGLEQFIIDRYQGIWGTIYHDLVSWEALEWAEAIQSEAVAEWDAVEHIHQVLVDEIGKLERLGLDSNLVGQIYGVGSPHMVVERTYYVGGIDPLSVVDISDEIETI